MSVLNIRAPPTFQIVWEIARLFPRGKIRARVVNVWGCWKSVIYKCQWWASISPRRPRCWSTITISASPTAVAVKRSTSVTGGQNWAVPFELREATVTEIVRYTKTKRINKKIQKKHKTEINVSRHTKIQTQKLTHSGTNTHTYTPLLAHKHRETYKTKKLWQTIKQNK